MHPIPADSFVCTPASGRGPGVLVLHAWWGLNDFTRRFCARLAGEGFTVLAPDLYHGRTAATIEEAEKLRSTLKRKNVEVDLPDALRTLRKHPAVPGENLGVIGFSLGAWWGLWLASAHPAGIHAVTTFYGNNGVDLSSSQAAFLCHFAESDPYVSASGKKQLEKNLHAAGRPVTMHTYPGTGHWFFEDDRPDAFVPAAAELAWQRTVAFIESTLKS